MNQSRLMTFALLAIWLIPPSFVRAAGTPASSPDSSSPPEFDCLDSAHVTVGVLSTPLPADSTALDSFLWHNFVKGADCDRFDCPLLGWRERARSFATALVQKARTDSLDAQSLQICLDKVLADAGGTAYLPIGASSATYRGVPAWVIVVKWEYASSLPRDVLLHARVYVLDAKHGRQLGFWTCL